MKNYKKKFLNKSQYFFRILYNIINYVLTKHNEIIVIFFHYCIFIYYSSEQ